MTDKKKLIILAKGGNKKVATAKKPVEKMEEKKLTPTEERDLKAKQKVEELLQDVSMSPMKEEETLIELDEPKGTEWLSEQVSALTAENEVLKGELLAAKNDYKKVFEENQKIRSGNSNNLVNETITQNILILFNELQNNKLGHNPERTIWTIVNVDHVLKQMLSLFPFTANYKKF